MAPEGLPESVSCHTLGPCPAGRSSTARSGGCRHQRVRGHDGHSIGVLGCHTRHSTPWSCVRTRAGCSSRTGSPCAAGRCPARDSPGRRPISPPGTPSPGRHQRRRPHAGDGVFTGACVSCLGVTAAAYNNACRPRAASLVSRHALERSDWVRPGNAGEGHGKDRSTGRVTHVAYCGQGRAPRMGCDMAREVRRPRPMLQWQYGAPVATWPRKGCCPLGAAFCAGPALARDPCLQAAVRPEPRGRECSPVAAFARDPGACRSTAGSTRSTGHDGLEERKRVAAWTRSST